MDSARKAGISPADEQFLAAFEAGQITNQDFHHRDHLRLAWIQIRRLGLERAADAVVWSIRQFAARHGHADRYHETMTRFWVFTSPTRYRLGRSGWVSARFPKGSAIPLDMFRDWIAVSYRAVAPASLVKKPKRSPLRE